MSNRAVNQEFATWLRRKMTDSGYPVIGTRAGGPSRLAKDSGVSLSALSRVLNEGRIPDVRNMRLLAPLLHTTLTEMLLRSGQATPADFPASATGRLPASVVEAIDADPELDADDRRALKTHYAGLIAFARQRRRMAEPLPGPAAAGELVDPTRGRETEGRPVATPPSAPTMGATFRVNG